MRGAGNPCELAPISGVMSLPPSSVAHDLTVLKSVLNRCFATVSGSAH